MVAEFKQSQGIDLSKDKMALQRLYEAAEKAKIELSTTMSTAINLPFITADENGPKHLDLTLTRAKFDELTHDLVERVVDPVKRAIKDAGLKQGRHRPRDPRRRHDPHAGRAGEGQGAHRQGARTRASTRTRSSPSARPSRAACWPARSRTCCCSTSRRCRSASRPRAACSRGSSSATRRSRPRRARSSPPPTTTRRASRSTCSRASATWRATTRRWASSSSSASRRRRAASRRSRSRSTSTPTASCT